MTRYTNLAFKRKYLQPGFDDAEEPSRTAELEVNSEPEKKRRKRIKKKAKGLSEGDGEAETISEANPKEAGNGQHLSNRRLYKQRRAKEFREKMKEKMKNHKPSSEKRRLSRIQKKKDDMICFACRGKGHSLKDCPSTGESGPSVPTTCLCFRCGSTKHTLSKCKKPIPEDPDNSLPYANCFVCKASGHLSSSCPSNKSKGIYPNGGCCKLCGETSHLAKDCEIREKDNHKDTLLVGSGKNAGADEDDFHIVSRGRREMNNEEEKKTRGKLKRLVGGKFVVRVETPTKPVVPKKVPSPTTKVKTVVF